MKFPNTYFSGDSVPATGSYTSLHSTPHRLVHREVYLEGERFEPCKVCPLGVIYRFDQSGVNRPLLANLSPQVQMAR